MAKKSKTDDYEEDEDEEYDEIPLEDEDDEDDEIKAEVICPHCKKEITITLEAHSYDSEE